MMGSGEWGVGSGEWGVGSADEPASAERQLQTCFKDLELVQYREQIRGEHLRPKVLAVGQKRN